MGFSLKTVFGVTVLAGGLALSVRAQQKPLPDAQVEANVLRALASAPELSTQNIQTTTVYGVVTLSGSAIDEASRTKAENLAARAEGVKKVVDEMTLGPATNTAADSQGDPAAVNSADPAQGANGMVLQSDGSYAPAQAGQEPPPPGQQADNGAPQPQGVPEPGYTSPSAPPANGQYPQAASGQYPPNGQYPPQRAYGNSRGYPPIPGGQVAGQRVTIPAGALVRIRINQGLSSKHTQPGSVFDGTVLNDVIADGAVAIPRGASIQGTVVDAKSSGALKGRGELALQLTSLNLGGKTYTLTSDNWTRTGADKTTHTVNSAIGLGALGALFGAAAGGGTGAAIGAGVGGAAGIASSAASPNGQIVIPPEAVLTFHLAQPATVATVSEQEMGRLAYAAGPNGPRPVVQRRYPGPYYAPYPVYYYPR
jgi:hypothetical protein